MKFKLQRSLLGLLFFWGGFICFIAILLTVEEINYIVVLIAILLFGSGATLLASPAAKVKRINYIIALVISPFSFLSGLHVMDLIHIYGIHLSKNEIIFSSLCLSLLLSLIVMFDPSVKNNN